MMTVLERAVYLDLLFYVYELGGCIPSDQAVLTRLAMVTPEEFSLAWPAVSRHFISCEDDPTMLTNAVAVEIRERHLLLTGHHRSAGNISASGAVRDSSGKFTKRRPANDHQQTVQQADQQTVQQTDQRTVQQIEIDGEPEEEKEESTLVDSANAEIDVLVAGLVSFPATKANSTHTAARSAAEQGDSLAASDRDESRQALDSWQKAQRARPIKSKPTADQQLWFEIWWDAYWLHKSKKAALQAFVKGVKSQVMFDKVMAATVAQSPEMLARDPDKRPHGSTWLNQERWNDEPAAPKKSFVDKVLDELKKGERA